MTWLNRREFLRGTALTLGGAALGPLSPADAQPATTPAPGTYTQFTATHWGPVYAHVEGGKFVRVTPFSKDPYPSRVLNSFADRVYASSRIKSPMVRADFLKRGAQSDTSQRGRGEFVRVTWQDALDLVARELKRVKSAHGNQAIFAGSVDWHSVGFLHNPPVLLRRLLNLNGGFVDCSGDFSVQAAATILPHVVGDAEVYDQQSAWPTILKHTNVLVLWGANLMINNLIGWNPTDHYVYSALPQLKKSQVRIISIDPRRTETAEYLGADWVPLRPNTDVALMLGIAHTLYTEKLYDRNFLAKYTFGFDRFLEYVLGKTDDHPKTPEWAAAITQVPASTIRSLARTIARGRTMLMGGWAIQRQDHGEQPPWMLVTLAAMLGQIGLPGGGFGFGYHYASGGVPAADAPEISGIDAGTNPVKLVIPYDHMISDLLLHPGQTIDFNGQKLTFPDIKLVYWAGGNPLSHQMDRNRQIEAWRRPETIIVNEIFWTPTAKFADIVLPVTTTFERNDLEIMGEYSHRYILAMHKVVDPLYEARSDYAIFSDLSDRLGVRDKYTAGRDEMGWIRSFYDAARKKAGRAHPNMQSFDQFWQKGYVEFPIPATATEFVKFADFRANPALHALGTPSGRIEIYSKTIEGYHYEDCPPHPSWLEPVEWLGSSTAKEYPLHLISPHPKDRLHSQLNNTSIRQWYEISGREPILLHPTDAKARGISNGDVVRVFNRRGQFLAGAVVTDQIRPQVVAVHEGSWYDPDKPGEIGALDKHGNVNLVTSDKSASKLSQGNIANTVLVQVEKYRETPPPVTAFTPPNGG
jgi:trimethylamine-N-oxide reductase (cytochrome c)